MTSHPQPKIFTEDLLIRDALLKHDGKVTRHFFYQKCYPIFKSIYDNYYTDCACVKEFMKYTFLLLHQVKQQASANWRIFVVKVR